jgi:hypothetical protein
MSWIEKAMARGLRLGDARTRARLAAIAEQAGAAGIRSAVEGPHVVLSGRGLARRMRDEASLRLLGRWS